MTNPFRRIGGSPRRRGLPRAVLSAAATLCVLAAPLVALAPPAQAAVGIRTSAGRIVESGGQDLVLRGINHPHTWFPSQTRAFADIKAAGANSVRVVLSGGRWQPANTAADVAAVIGLCKQNRLICVLENHDTTGFGEQGGAVSLDAAVNYWISVQSALTGQENFVILNIGNEPYGNNNATAWTAATADAIRRLRTAGFQHAIMVDAPNWGQDWQFVMRDTAPTVLAADSLGNTVFSIHMYGVFDTAAEIQAYVSSFVTRRIPLVIGEFGHNHSDGNPDEDAIMSVAQANGIGHMGWSWSGNSGGVEYLDMVAGFNPASRTPWGTRYIAGANGLLATSREAAIYGGGGGGDSTPPSQPTGLVSSGITATSVNLSWQPATDNVAVTGYEVLRAPGASGGSFTVVGSVVATSFGDTGLTPASVYRYQVRARDAAGNLSTVSATISVTTASGGGGGGCTVSPTVGSQWGDGYVIQVRLTNTGSATTSGWATSFTLPSGHRVTNVWSATLFGSPVVSARNVSYNGVLAPGQGTDWGFQAVRPAGDPALPTFGGCTTS